MSDKRTNEQEEFNRMVNQNTILLSLAEWIKYVEGLTRGLQMTEKVSSAAVLDCIGEIMEYMTVFRRQLITLLTHCENVMEENEKLKADLEKLQNGLDTPLISNEVSINDFTNQIIMKNKEDNMNK